MWVLSQDGMKLVKATEVMLEGNTVLVNGLFMGRYALLSDALLQVRRLVEWIEQGEPGVFQLDQE